MILDSDAKKEIRDKLMNKGASYVAIFGSHIKGNETSSSDVDVLVEFSEPKTLIDVVRIERELSDLIGKDVDLVTKKSLSPLISKNLEKEALMS
ncbi:MAG: Minimal nucleotidyltransferase [Candidatus Methanohalarchaeum thermophilum]|uniref:protein adenylyltransferase n=1 Tax=Methanohalarchaeum thermophilum TaxID=1903181 RepID=A0A1Q6DT68_METT1|nr:MAG: Minimal nucleotidyltransferase [Candidatus Methanohalarchaeum thermophilum]